MPQTTLDHDRISSGGRRRLLRKEITVADLFDEIREVQGCVDELTAEHRQLRADVKALREMAEEER
jgi:hypothetical protein